MFLHLIKAEYVKDFIIDVTFNDGYRGLADLSEALQGEVFEKLKDINEFSKFRIDNEFKTLVWESGADLAPEFIYYCAFKEKLEFAERFKLWGYVS
ncbi:MAG: DUF2442 domain-containing protein [Methylococcaceae bacterium]